jgi:hypothetical protein
MIRASSLGCARAHRRRKARSATRGTEWGAGASSKFFTMHLAGVGAPSSSIQA